MLYTSIENKKIKDIKKLYDKKYRVEFEKFLVEGEHLVLEAFKKGVLCELIIEDGYDFKLNIDTNYVTNSVMKYLSELDSSPKVIGICNKIEEKQIIGNVLMLDQIQDPGNLGTIIRSCVAFNIDTLILGEGCVDIYNSKVIRATQGMIFNINIIQKNIYYLVDILKKNNYIIYGTKVNGGKSLKSIDNTKKFAIIMGNEGNGVKKQVLDLCDEFLYIDMNKSCESLNVAIATSIILYELSK